MDGLAEVPLCRGALFPFGAHPVVQVHAVHRLNALLVAAVVIGVAVHVWRRAGESKLLRRLALTGPLLVVVQITLGVLSVLSWLDLATVTAHLGVGALELLAQRGQLAQQVGPGALGVVHPTLRRALRSTPRGSSPSPDPRRSGGAEEGRRARPRRR